MGAGREALRRRGRGLTPERPGRRRRARRDARPEAEGARLTRVALLLPNRFPGLPSYRVPEDVGSLVPGARVAAPFGSALATGLVVSLDPPLPPEGTVERDIVAALDDTPFLDERLVKVLVRAAAYYLVPPGELLRAAVPARLLGASEAVYVPTPHSVGAHLEGVAGEILTTLLEVGEARLAELAARA
ncbi:MAG: primosomal protein N' family DNA-binding protein, partial [Thermoanaerobaculia bacterium]